MISRIINMLKSLIHINRYKAETEIRFLEMQTRIEGLEARITELDTTIKSEINDIVNIQFEKEFNNLMVDSKKLKLLNLQLSATPIIWGDESRLDISEKAAVNSCVFNTNSGKIRIGDYTYAGSGVSILAGSHDQQLKGFIRRDVEYKEGFDIEIGNGVWLASNSTILGPCVIEDDAVVASGAVVVPGTHIGKGEIYAGVPARKISDIAIINDLEDDPQKLAEVTERETGVLFYSGWSEKKLVGRNGEAYFGHWTDAGKSVIYTDKEELKLVFIADTDKSFDVRILIDNEEKETFPAGYDPLTIEVATNSGGKLVKTVIESAEPVFVSRNEK